MTDRKESTGAIKQEHQTVILRADVEQIAAFTHAIDTNPALGLLVKKIEVSYHGLPSIWPISPHVVGRLSNLEYADFVATTKHRASDTSFIRLFAAPCQSLKTLLLAFFGFSMFSDLVRLICGAPGECRLGTSFLTPLHVSKLTTLHLWLDYPVPAPLSLTPFGNNLRTLDIRASHSYASTIDYKGLASLERLASIGLRFSKEDISFVLQALTYVRSRDLRLLVITHRVEDQSLEGTMEQLEALNPKLQDLLARPAFWDLRRVVWEVLCKVLPKAEEREQWKLSVTQFLQVMAHRKILRVTVGDSSQDGVAVEYPVDSSNVV
ncbi:hypothetical protein C8Q76DRAFT_782195 [Earliella scabrosa]|nr:hypothetical protein C8Q76DRAFT_782195 [Earliella scabrosa]